MLIVRSLVRHSSAANNGTRAVEQQGEFTPKKEQYCGAPFKDELLFDVELLSNLFDELKHTKAAGLDSSSAEHLLYCYPIILSILTKLFKLMLRCSYLPVDLGLS